MKGRKRPGTRRAPGPSERDGYGLMNGLTVAK